MHVQRSVTGCFAVLRQLRSIRRLVPSTIYQSLVVALVLSQLVYGNATLAASRPACLTVSSLSSTRLPSLLLDFGARSILQMLWPVFAGYAHPSALSSSWRLSSTKLSMVTHLSTYRISCSTLLIFRRDIVVASAHRLPIFSTSARRDVLLSAISRLLLQALNFGTACLPTSGRPRHLQHFVGS